MLGMLLAYHLGRRAKRGSNPPRRRPDTIDPADLAAWSLVALLFVVCAALLGVA